MRQIALTGPAAAQLWGLDGFREGTWRPEWCSPRTVRPRPDVIRTRHWEAPVLIGDVPVAPVQLVLRHLDSLQPFGGLTEVDRVELAVEHALRDGTITPEDLIVRGGGAAGDALLRRVTGRRPKGEPPTESYAETRTVQRMRSIGLVPWRQIPIIGSRRNRADFMLPFQRPKRQLLAPRPAMFLPFHGVLVELDSKEHHEGRFEEDHARETNYDELGYAWHSFTPNQIEHDWPRVARVLLRAVQP